MGGPDAALLWREPALTWEEEAVSSRGCSVLCGDRWPVTRAHTMGRNNKAKPRPGQVGDSLPVAGVPGAGQDRAAGRL